MLSAVGATLTFNDEAEQYLVTILLRPDNSPAKHGAVSLPRTPLRPLRRAFSGAMPRVRVDGGFAGNDWLDVLETQRVEYVVVLASNARLDHRAVKRMTRPMLGLKSLWAARDTIAGIEGAIGRHGRGVSHSRGTILALAA